MATIIVHNYTPTDVSINEATSNCEIVVIGTATRVVRDIEYYEVCETVSAVSAEEISSKLKQAAFEFIDEFANVKRIFGKIYGWCFDQSQGLTYCLLYYAIARLTTGIICNPNDRCKKPMCFWSGFV